MPSLPEAARCLRREALNLGFCDASYVRAIRSASYPYFRDWLAQGLHANMRHLEKFGDLRADPASILPGVRSLLMLAVPWENVPRNAEGFEFFPNETPNLLPGKRFGKVASYAARGDYHDWVRQRLRRLVKLHREFFPSGHARGVVDTAPLLEREYAERAGLGWIGKNTMLIHRQYGCRVILAAVISTEPLFDEEYTTRTPNVARLCGDCRRCLDACPTGALVAPMRLDARKCLNYWTIEDRATILPSEIAEKLDGRLFGCENCVDACPYGKNRVNRENENAYIDLDKLLAMGEADFRKIYGATPLARPGLEKLKATVETLRNS